MKYLGYNNGNIVKLHQLQNGETPMLSEEEFQRQLKYLSYDMLYGENYQFDGEKPFARVDMRMGTRPVITSDLRVMGDTVYVRGEGYTKGSKIFINGKQKKTIMLSQYSLMAKDVSIKPGDKVVVGQASSKKAVLSSSEAIIYNEELHKVGQEEPET